MQVNMKVKSKFDVKNIKQYIRTANFKSLEHVAAGIRLTALRSIRKGKMRDKQRFPSKPGQAPSTWDNRSGRRMKRSILYTKPERRGGQTAVTVHAGPDNAGDRVYQMHERGGTQTVELTRIIDDSQYRRSGGFHWQQNHYIPMEKRSEGQRRHIKNYYNNIKTSKKKKIRKTVRYQKRPFLDPAVKKNLSRIPAVFKANIQQQFH
jgi:hypothetical protein